MIRLYPLFALALLTAPDLATAEPARPQQISVAVDDLDLASAKGQRILALRIQRAAQTLCAGEVLASHPGTIRSMRRCVQDARASAAAAAETLTVAAQEGQERRGG